MSNVSTLLRFLLLCTGPLRKNRKCEASFTLRESQKYIFCMFFPQGVMTNICTPGVDQVCPLCLAQKIGRDGAPLSFSGTSSLSSESKVRPRVRIFRRIP